MCGQSRRIQRRDFIKAGLWATAGTLTLGSGIAIGAENDKIPAKVMLDTEALIWVDQNDPRIGAETREQVDSALARDALYVSSVSFWEVISLVRKNQIQMSLGVSEWRRSLLDAGIKELGVDGIIGVPEDDALDGDFFKTAMLGIKLRPLLNTPRDTIIDTPPHLLGSLIVASAARLRATFITTDQDILQWAANDPTLDAHDAQK